MRSIEEELVKIAKNVPKVYEAGKAQKDYEWWKKYQDNCEAYGEYIMAFAGKGWDDTIYNPIRQIRVRGNSKQMFAYSPITDTKVGINIAVGKANSGLVQTFYNGINLVYVRQFIIDEYTDMSAQFTSCSKLKYLTIIGTIGTKADFKSCPLNRVSIENVVSRLSTTTTGLTCTFKASAVSDAFTDEEWNALIATKQNWTITTV